MTSFKMVAAVGFAALLLPVAAVAKDVEVEGPLALAGAGFFGGELEMASPDEQRPVQIGGAAGYVGFLDLAGDLKVRCTGKGRVHEKKTDAGTVFLCAGRAGRAVAIGSHFKLRGFALHYRAIFPAGVSGSFHGRFAEHAGTTERPAVGERERTRATERPAVGKAEPKPKPKPKPDEDAEVPTLAELAALLAGK